MSGFLLDTNVVSELARRRPADQVLEFLVRQPDVWLSVITMHEIAYGIEKARDGVRRAQLEAWLAHTTVRFAGRILPLDRETAERAGRLRAIVESQGRPSGVLDTMIAAAAAVRGLVLATRNTAHFQAFGIPLHDPWAIV